MPSCPVLPGAADLFYQRVRVARLRFVTEAAVPGQVGAVDLFQAQPGHVEADGKRLDVRHEPAAVTVAGLTVPQGRFAELPTVRAVLPGQRSHGATVILEVEGAAVLDP